MYSGTKKKRFPQLIVSKKSIARQSGTARCF